MRHIFLTLLILFALVFTACSYTVEFVVINESDRPIEVRCKVVNLPGDPDPVGVVGPLSIANASQLRSGDNEWRRLSDSEYRADVENHSVTARVMPGEALLVKRFHDSSIQNGEPTYFPIEEIVITGGNGEIKLQGKQTSKAFMSETERLYTLTYK
jgi:hypothetical protein